jgi:flagellar hook-length control protein FliK
VADQVGPLLATLASGPDGTRTAGLSLVPPGLGVLRAEVESRAGQVAVRLWAASEAGYRALAAAAHELAASLAHAGLEVASVEVHHTARAGTGSSSDGNFDAPANGGGGRGGQAGSGHRPEAPSVNMADPRTLSDTDDVEATLAALSERGGIVDVRL